MEKNIDILSKTEENSNILSAAEKDDSLSETEDIKYLFKKLVKKYHNTDLELIECETKEKQKIRGATGSKVIQKVDLLIKYYPELEDDLKSLDKFIICKKHYNQIIRNDNFIDKLQKNLKFLNLMNDNYKKITNQLKESEQQRLFYINLVKELETKNNQLIVENNQLKEIINFNLNNQQICIKYIKEIAQKERKNLYNDLISLIDNQERFNFATESCRFRVQIRKINFVNPNNNDFQSFNGEWTLSEEIKKFSELAQLKRIEFIQKILIEKNLTKTWHPIPIITEEANFQKSENALTKKEILAIINSLIPYLNDLDRLKFKNLSNLSHNN
ncbi:10156_t:CDS:2, partial [Racocetra fulgida]